MRLVLVSRANLQKLELRFCVKKLEFKILQLPSASMPTKRTFLSTFVHHPAFSSDSTLFSEAGGSPNKDYRCMCM